MNCLRDSSLETRSCPLLVSSYCHRWSRQPRGDQRRRWCRDLGFPRMEGAEPNPIQRWSKSRDFWGASARQFLWCWAGHSHQGQRFWWCAAWDASRSEVLRWGDAKALLVFWWKRVDTVEYRSSFHQHLLTGGHDGSVDLLHVVFYGAGRILNGIDLLPGVKWCFWASTGECRVSHQHRDPFGAPSAAPSPLLDNFLLGTKWPVSIL